MVTICTKKFMNTREKLLSYTGKKRNESKDLEDFLKKLKERGEKAGSSRVLSGTTVPNSTFKSIHSNDQWKSKNNDSSLSAAEVQGNNKNSKTSASSIKGPKFSSKNLIKKEEPSSEVLIEPDNKRTSILSGTGTLEELKELKHLLHKSSYVPKQARTRRPTIEKIKNAIEKEKLTLIDKSETTIEETVTQSDASTSTLKKKKKKTKPKSSTPSVPGSNTSQGTKKKKKVKKSTTKVDAEIQCSLYKMRKAALQS